jgi:hypothetical protein
VYISNSIWFFYSVRVIHANCTIGVVRASRVRTDIVRSFAMAYSLCIDHEYNLYQMDGDPVFHVNERICICNE